METFEGLALECPVSFTKALYHADADDMMRVLRGATEQTVLMLGHNPGIADFAEQLVSIAPDHPRFFDYPTCATLVATFDATTWRDIDWHSGTATAFAIPREVMAED